LSNPDKSRNPAGAHKAPPGSVSIPGEEYPPPAIDPDAVKRIEDLVSGYVETLTSLDSGTSEGARALDAIARLGERDFIVTASLSGRLLDRRFKAMNEHLASKAPMARRLTDLRKAADELDPSRLRLGGGRSPSDEMRELDRYFERFSRTQPKLESILADLTQSRFVLEQDNAAIVTEQEALAAEVDTLRQFAFLAERLDSELETRIRLIAESDAARAKSLKAQALTVVKRRRAEILMQLTIATQGYAALEVVESNNAEVIKSVASAITTTSTALRTAVVVAQAAASQRMVLEHLEAARMAATTMAGNAATLEAEVAGPGGRIDEFKQAWTEVRASLDRVDAQKAEVLRSISSADRELTHPPHSFR